MQYQSCLFNEGRRSNFSLSGPLPDYEFPIHIQVLERERFLREFVTDKVLPLWKNIVGSGSKRKTWSGMWYYISQRCAALYT